MSETEATNETPDAGAESAGATAGQEKNAATPPVSDAPTSWETLRKERDELHDRYLRAVADLDNYRRRVVREKDELRQFAIKGVIESLVPVLENLGFAVASAKQTADPQVIATGVTMVLEQFRGALSSVGLVEINPAPGADFDPHQHESIAHAPSDSIPAEKIAQIVRSGFSLNGRLIRPASVILSSGKAAPASS